MKGITPLEAALESMLQEQQQKSEGGKMQIILDGSFEKALEEQAKRLAPTADESTQRLAIYLNALEIVSFPPLPHEAIAEAIATDHKQNGKGHVPSLLYEIRAAIQHLEDLKFVYELMNPEAIKIAPLHTLRQLNAANPRAFAGPRGVGTPPLEHSQELPARPDA